MKLSILTQQTVYFFLAKIYANAFLFQLNLSIE